jgi:N-methylhydantoinase A
VCYRRGGSEPTVTDAHLALGRIPAALLGGELPLDVNAARAAIDARVGRPLRLGVEEAAAGIVEIIDNAMARAIRTVSVGTRPRSPALSPSSPSAAPGRSTPAASPSCWRFPPSSCRRGRVSSPRRDCSTRTSGPRSCARWGRTSAAIAEGGASLPTLESAWADLEAQARVWLEGEEVPRDQMRFERAADLRYEHQSFELTCPLGEGPVTHERLGALVSTFHAEHRRLYTYDLPNAPIELVTLQSHRHRLPARSAPRRPPSPPAGGEGRVRGSSRPVYFRGRGFRGYGRFIRVMRSRRGLTFHGPAIIEQS